MPGLGNASGGAIENAITHNLKKFQYCYEKALLGDPDIGGTAQLAWSIISGGKATPVRVKNTQIRNEALMSCIKAELMKIKFPSPSGGNVDVEYPFSFRAGRL